MKKKMFTWLVLSVCIIASLQAQTGERYAMEYGKYYVFRVVGDESKVIAYYEGAGNFIVEPYVVGNENQLFQKDSYSGEEEDYMNFSIVANGYCWDDHGRPIKPDPQPTPGAPNTWVSYDLELNEEGNVRFCHFLERWMWTATWEPQYKGVFLFLSGSDVAAMEYIRCKVSGERDYSEYESMAGELFDFKVEEIGSTEVKGVDIPNVKITARKNKICLENVENKRVEIFSVAGQLAGSFQTGNSTAEITVPASGIYVVKVNSEVFKVAVK